MIKASELRIGNLIQDDTRTQHVVKGVSEDGIEIDRFYVTVKEHGGVFYPGPVAAKIQKKEISFATAQPIPLTPEILEKCGFKMMSVGKYKDWGNWHLDKNQHLISYDDRHDVEGFSYNGCTLWHPTKYLHQLQNLYFALTGEELEIKL